MPSKLPRAFLLPEWPRPTMHHPAIEDHPAFLCRFEFGQTRGAVRHYNPAIAQLGGKQVMAWRVQDERGVSRILAATLGKGHKPGKPTEIKIEAPARTHVEDPRLIVIEGALVLFVAVVNYSAAYSFRLRAFVLGENFQPVREIPLPYGKNGQGTHEKNWMPFRALDGQLGLVYQIAPEHVVIDTESGEIFRTPGIARWRWGTASGRTNAVLLPDGQRFLALIGGHQAHPTRKSEYWAAAYTFAAKAPYAMLGVSAEPILWASGRTPAILNPFDPQWNPLCIFPAGLVRDGDHALVSLGLNDSYCALMRWPVAELLGNLVDPAKLTGEEKLIAAPTKAAPIGNIRVRCKSRQPLGEPGGPYQFGDEFFTSEDRVEALGDKVEVLA